MEKIMDYSEDSIPVLSQDGHMLGVITSEDIVEMVTNEMGEDYAKLAGLTAEEDLKETTAQSMKKTSPMAHHPAVPRDDRFLCCRCL